MFWLKKKGLSKRKNIDKIDIVIKSKFECEQFCNTKQKKNQASQASITYLIKNAIQCVNSRW